MTEPFEILPLDDRGHDGRGAAFFFDPVTIAWLGQVAEIHVVAIAPGKVRGNHQHRDRREVVFLRHDDAVEIAWRGASGNVERERRSGPGAFLVRIEPRTLHAFKNAGEGRVEVVSLSNGHFDRTETEYDVILE
jgi:hypothetical protein